MTTPVDTIKSAVLGSPPDPNKQPSRLGVVQAFEEIYDAIPKIGVVSVLDYGAVGDGTTDDSAAINSALAAGNNVVFPAGYTFKFRNIKITDSVYIFAHGATLKAFFNDAVSGTTERLFYSEPADDVDNIVIVGGNVDGSYDSSVTLTNELSVFHFDGGGNVIVDNVIFNNCGTGTTSLPTLILDRSYSLVHIHDARYAQITNCVSQNNYKYNEFRVTSSDARTRYVIEGNESLNVAGNSIDSGVTVCNCGPGRIWHNRIENRTVSAINAITHRANIQFNKIYYIRNSGGTGGSYGIDTFEQLFYAEGCYIANNIIDECYRAGITAAGDGTKIARNKITNCVYGIYVRNDLDASATTYGSWLDGTEKPIRGMICEGNLSYDHNAQAASTNAGLYIQGVDSTNVIDMIINAPAYKFSLTQTEYTVMLENTGKVVFNGGHLSDARNALVLVNAGTNKEIIFNDVTFEYDSDGTVHGIQYSGTINLMQFNDCHFLGDNGGASYYDIVRVSPGAITKLEWNNVTAEDDAGASRALEMGSTVATTVTEMLTDGLIGAVEVVWNSPSVAAGGTQSTTTTVTGAATNGHTVTVNNNSWPSGLVLQGYVSAADTVTIEWLNPTGAAIDPGNATYTVKVHP